MAPEKAKRNTRSRSCGKLRGRSPSPAAPNSAHEHLLVPDRPSRSPSGSLPVEKVNKDKDVGAKHPPESPEVRVSALISIEQQQVNIDSNLNSSPVINPPPSIDSGESSLPDAPSAGVMGDNTEHNQEAKNKVPLSNAAIAETLSQVLSELKDIKSQFGKLDKMEIAITSINNQISGVVERTVELETAVRSNAARLREVDDEIATLKNTTERQGKTLISTKKWKEEIILNNNKNVTRMNELVETQQKQVDSFNDNSNQLSQTILSEVDKRVLVANKELKSEFETEISELKAGFKKALRCQELKSQAFNNRQNLVVIGLQEDDQKSDTDLARDFFSKTLGAGDIAVTNTRRLGTQPQEDSSYIRPLMVKFSSLEERNKVWKKRMDITSEDGTHKIRVQADLPKTLREGLQVMQRVVKAAAKIPEYASTKINNYQLEVNDKTYQVSDLESLPKPIRPSTISAPRSDTAMVFFTRHAYMSNHHLSDFKIDNEVYHSIEQYLAVNRATLAKKTALIDKARKAQDPVLAKHVLNALKNDHKTEWDGQVENVLLRGLRAKFTQNQSIRDKLLSTGNLQLGEASKNPRWGIGMDLGDPEVLKQDKWLESGNLLGKSLMKIRDELQKKQKGKKKLSKA